jgi:hypothetical protein
VFRGEARLAYDHPVKRCSIDARGIDQRGASRARARFTVQAHGETTTEVNLEGNFEIAGPLETFASAGGVHVARALMKDFAANIAAAIEQQRTNGGVAAIEDAPPASGPEILGRALLEGARGVIQKARQKGNKESE